LTGSEVRWQWAVGGGIATCGQPAATTPKFKQLASATRRHTLSFISNQEQHHELISHKKRNDSHPNRAIGAAALKQQQRI
jgi:hypothetical protein